jgi:biofilm PGA synthesis N-glycosyltransferase PgaC
MIHSSHEFVADESVKPAKLSTEDGLPPQYIVIMPARDEEENIGRALASLVGQLCAASTILVVDDGSTDATADIVRQYAREYPSVRLLPRPNRGKRQPGPGVVDAFYEGFKSFESCSYDFVAKLDADCEYPPDYFQKILSEFQRNPKLGICGGVACIRKRSGLQMDRRPIHHVRGATKIYRKSCFMDIGGIERALGWDILDDFTARFKGWEAYTLETVHYVSNRTVGGPIGLWRKWMYEGRIAYMQDHFFPYLMARSIRRFANKPYILGGLLIIVGYFVTWWEKLPRIENQNLIQSLRQEQRQYLRKLLKLKVR